MVSLIKKVTKRISPHLKEKGFDVSGKCFYYIRNDIAYCIGLDAPGGLLYVTAYVMPLYVPCENRYYTYGNRLNAIQCVSLPILKKNEDESSISNWCALLFESIEYHILPFFDKISTPPALVAYAEEATGRTGTFFFCPDIYVYRLKLFTSLYLSQYDIAERTAEHYRVVLQRSLFLTANLRQKFNEEIDMLTSMLRNNPGEINGFMIQTIQNTVEQYFVC